MIEPFDESLRKKLIQKIDLKTKPKGSLGYLEDIAIQVGLIQNTLNPVIEKSISLIFAADHGIAKAGVSAFDQEVTRLMALNFASGNAAINVLCRANEIDLEIIDSGINSERLPEPVRYHRIENMKGSHNFLIEPAMTVQQALHCLDEGKQCINLYAKEHQAILPGEMGIANTAASSALMAVLLDLPVEECTGTGTGINPDQLENKKKILKQAIESRSNRIHSMNTIELVAEFGGLEILMMAGAILQAAELRKVIIVDGFIATVALLIAYKLSPVVLQYCIFSHCSQEMGHRVLLRVLNQRPILDLNLRLGEGSGAALALPVVRSAARILTEMASFEQAGISTPTDERVS